MKQFMDRDFLLTTETARNLYRKAENLPIADYHCHVSAREIFEDKNFGNLFQIWLSGDHYKWRLMRANGVDERYITGNAPEREKFQKFAETLPRAIGNPLYHWCHLELQRYFDYHGILNGETAQEVWDLAEARLQSGACSVRRLIQKSNVTFIGTTDDPTDTLEWHEKIQKDSAIKTTVAPTFRPDKAINAEKDGWTSYLSDLSNAAHIEIHDFASLKTALQRRMDRFAECGCRAGDHGLDFMVYAPYTEQGIDGILKKALEGIRLSEEETAQYKTALLSFCAAEYTRRGWVMQIHYNCLRNPNTDMYRQIGPDTGFDCIGPNNGAVALASFLNALFSEKILPRTILYSLDGGDDAMLDCLIGAFQSDEIPGKIQHGSAWWFNDHKDGIRRQLKSLSALGILGNFVGMLTDSRSFLSYARHEYFRRILCDLIGRWVEDGEYPKDEKTLSALVEDICYRNATRYFSLEEEQDQ